MDDESSSHPQSPESLDHGIADTVLKFEQEQRAGHPKEASKILNKSDQLAQDVSLIALATDDNTAMHSKGIAHNAVCHNLCSSISLLTRSM